jgi:predicted secreted protein
MSVISALAIFFIIWWLVLFTVLPIGIRSQVEDEDVTLGTEHGAPARPALVRKALLTTAIAIVIFGIFYIATVIGGFGFDDLPRIVPRFQ